MKRVVGLNIRYKAERKQRQQAQITSIRADITIKEGRQSNANMECGVSDWFQVPDVKHFEGVSKLLFVEIISHSFRGKVVSQSETPHYNKTRHYNWLQPSLPPPNGHVIFMIMRVV